jgi:hypothetical protein
MVKRSRKRSICLGFDGVDGKTALDQRLDHRPVRDFDRHLDAIWLGGAACRHQKGGHLREPLAAMCEGSFADLAAFAVGEEDAVALAPPVDAGIPLSLIVHPRLQRRAAATFADPCTGARNANVTCGANSSWASIAANPSRHASPYTLDPV